jgi:hypothetical protein
VRWDGLQQHTMAAPPAAAAPANSAKAPPAAVPASTVAQSNSLLIAISPALQATSRSYLIGAERYLNNHMRHSEGTPCLPAPCEQTRGDPHAGFDTARLLPGRGRRPVSNALPRFV